ncbi:MAG: hypothetical protein Q7S68_01100, partial [Deltaproteobacteria bacterium]|nr:hypothetical protein [Deltaproteobacteria bacterium]
MKQTRFFLIFALFFLLAIAACDSGTFVAEIDETQSADGSGVADGVAGSASAPPTYYPHATDWKKGSNHGVAYKAAGEEICISCHQMRAEAPTCVSCHPSY